MPLSKQHKAKIAAGLRAYHSSCKKKPKKATTKSITTRFKKDVKTDKILEKQLKMKAKAKLQQRLKDRAKKKATPKPKKKMDIRTFMGKKPRKRRTKKQMAEAKAMAMEDRDAPKPKPVQRPKPKPRPKPVEKAKEPVASGRRAFPLKPEKPLKKKIRYTDVGKGLTAWGKFGKRLHEQYVASLTKSYSPAQLPTLENINKLKKGSVVVVQARNKNPNSVKWERFYDGYYDARGRELETYDYYDDYIGEEIIVDKVSKSKKGNYSLSGLGQQQMPQSVVDVHPGIGGRQRVNRVPISTTRPIIYIKKY